MQCKGCKEQYLAFALSTYNGSICKKELRAAMKIQDLMSYPIATVCFEATVLEAIQMMVDDNKGSLIVVARDGLLKEALGIITTSQIFQKVFAVGLDPSEVKVSKIMTPSPLIIIDLNASPFDAASLMLKHGIKRLPVVKDGVLVGIITSKDLLKCVD